MDSIVTQWIVAGVVSTYWLCVLVMSIRSRIKFRTPSGSLPKTRLEKTMWIAWVPTIAAWIAISWNSSNEILANVEAGQMSVLSQIYLALVWVFAIVAVVAFGLTVNCWIRMGKNWSMAVRPDKETELITDGLFSAVRHPIYALSLTLMICSLLVIFNWKMLIVATIHCSLLILKAWNEERYLIGIHGQQYLDYLSKTNRFIPQLFPGKAISS